MCSHQRVNKKIYLLCLPKEIKRVYILFCIQTQFGYVNMAGESPFANKTWHWPISQRWAPLIQNIDNIPEVSTVDSKHCPYPRGGHLWFKTLPISQGWAPLIQNIVIVVLICQVPVYYAAWYVALSNWAYLFCTDMSGTYVLCWVCSTTWLCLCPVAVYYAGFAALPDYAYVRDLCIMLGMQHYLSMLMSGTCVLCWVCSTTWLCSVGPSPSPSSSVRPSA